MHAWLGLGTTAGAPHLPSVGPAIKFSQRPEACPRQLTANVGSRHEALYGGIANFVTLLQPGYRGALLLASPSSYSYRIESLSHHLVVVGWGLRSSHGE